MLKEKGQRLFRTSPCTHRLYTIWSVVVLALALTGVARADQPFLDSNAPVRFNGETLFVIHTGLADIDPAARAAAIEKRLERLAHVDPSIIDSLTIEDHEETSYVVTREEVLFVVTEQEAKLIGKPRHVLARERAERIQRAFRAIALPSVDTGPLPSSIHLRDLLWAGLATALLIFLAVAARIGFPLLYEFIDAWHKTRLRSFSFRGFELVSAAHLVDTLVFLSKFVRIVLSVFVLYAYFHFILDLFPQTRDFEQRLLAALTIPLDGMRGMSANWTSLIAGLLLTAVTTGLFLGALKLFRSLFPQAIEKISQWGRTTKYCLKIQRVELLSGAQIADGALGIVRILHVVAYASLVYLYVTSILGFFPATQQLSLELLGYLIEPLKLIGLTFVSSLPDFIAIVIIVLVTKYIIKLIHLFFTGIERGAITFQGFHRDWATPTYKIVRFFALVFAAVAIVPYIPGSHSEAFKGISVFLGVLVSLGAAGSFSNIVAGIVLTYMRPFSVGDRVKIAETTGDITEKTLLVTRIRTNKNVDVTIPNALVLSSHIINFSSSATNPPPLILNTSVTIGYDVPWRKVHELLVAAAKRTTYILETPEPFVLQTSLNDYHVTYEINGYTKHPNQMAAIYAELHQHIQDQFNEAGVEIMSPHYTQVRDGNKTTIPDEYLPKDYQVPGIRIWPLRSPRIRSESPSSDRDTPR
ncbi:MAG: mechanosensitive ion channel family protein [Nitrospira sp.]|nr:mechanosensitive ion channel family protein [Nitrospira sp.]